MAIIESTRPVPLGAVATLTVVNFLSNTVDNFFAAITAAKTRKALAALSNRQLDDIGLIPGDINTISRRVTLRH